jgi:hypothetical protein
MHLIPPLRLYSPTPIRQLQSIVGFLGEIAIRNKLVCEKKQLKRQSDGTSDVNGSVNQFGSSINGSLTGSLRQGRLDGTSDVIGNCKPILKQYHL